MVHRGVDLVFFEARGSCPCAVACWTFCVTRGTDRFTSIAQRLCLPDADARARVLLEECVGRVGYIIYLPGVFACLLHSPCRGGRGECPRRCRVGRGSACSEREVVSKHGVGEPFFCRRER